MLEVVIGLLRKILFYVWRGFLLAKMVSSARIKIERFCGVKSLISSMKTPTPVEGKLVVFMIDGRLSIKRALCGRETWREPWLTCLVERAPHKLPLGRHKQKETKRKGKSQDLIRAQFVSEMVTMNENHISRQEESAQMRLAMKEQGDKEQERFKINLMMEDLDKYTPERKKYLHGEQNDILRRNATRSIFQDDDSSQDYHPSPSPSQDGGYHY
ncbi:uncharacterized protein LOC126605819 [Malus sylvestris]|uniref:uncharacterized protein LOC126605819 n=1 Tax=Malus sylvestris TaxID=3752 RepID=UPI0021AC9DB8|nr:uncharacterized protein LOC126605819 [Malus sylvestris]